MKQVERDIGHPIAMPINNEVASSYSIQLLDFLGFGPMTITNMKILVLGGLRESTHGAG